MLPKAGYSAVLALAATVLAQGSTPIIGNLSTCATIAKDQASYLQEFPNGPGYKTTAAAAYNCISSVMINVQDATQFLDSIVPYLNFQTSLAYLKDPPPSYQKPAVDVLGEIQSVRNNLTSGGFLRQYDFDVALQRIISNASDFHLALQSGVFGLFQFTLNYHLVSVSTDGVALPKVYVYEDLNKTGAGPGTSNKQDYTPSAIKSINGQDVETYLRNWISNNQDFSFLEEHTDWNNAFHNAAYLFQWSHESGLAYTNYYNGDNLNGTFENGTDFSWLYEATTSNTLVANGLTDEQSIYSSYVLQVTSATPSASAAATTSIDLSNPTNSPFEPNPLDPNPTTDASPANPTGSEEDPEGPTVDTIVPTSFSEPAFVSAPTDAPSATGVVDRLTTVMKRNGLKMMQVPEWHGGSKAEVMAPSGLSSVPGPYPTDPIVTQSQLGFGGFVTGYNLKDQSLAVLSLPSFENSKDNYTVNVTDYAIAVQDFIKKSKDAGMQKVIIDLQSNGGGVLFLGAEIFRLFFPDIVPFSGWRMRATKELNAIGSIYTGIANGSIPTPDGSKAQISLPWDAASVLNANGTAYTKWEQMFGPLVDHSDNFTNTARYNFSNTKFILQSNGPISLGNPTDPRPWDAKDILLLTDGWCGSTCAVFSESMKTEVGVRSVVVGGLPMTGPMQAVAGTRGGQTYNYKDTSNVANAINLTEQQVNVTDPDLSPLLTPSRYWIRSLTFNLKDQIRKDSEIPLQFTYEAADCRIFYTTPMITDYTVLWTTAANAIWKNSSLCVDGSTNNPSAGNETNLNPPPTSTGSAASTTSSSAAVADLFGAKSLVAVGAAMMAAVMMA